MRYADYKFNVTTLPCWRPAAVPIGEMGEFYILDDRLTGENFYEMAGFFLIDYEFYRFVNFGKFYRFVNYEFWEF